MAYAELAHEAFTMGLDRSVTDLEFGGDFPIRLSPCYSLENLPLPGRQLGQGRLSRIDVELSLHRRS